MPIVEYRSRVPAPREDLFAWHVRPGALRRLLPPWTDVRVVQDPGRIDDGAEVVLSVPVGPVRRRWVARHLGFEPPKGFVDQQVEGPFGSWRHEHGLLPSQSAGSELVDRIEYEPPFGAAGAALGGAAIRDQLDRMFAFRHERTAGDIKAHARFRDRGPLRVAITGASGLIGSALRPFLTGGGHRADVLVRRKPDAAKGEIAWGPAAGAIDSAALEGVDAVVHLAGENISRGRWTDARKAEFRASRVDSTRLLCRTLARLERPPKVLVSASAIGFYGDRADERLTEDSLKGAGFLPELADEWEAATAEASAAGIRVVNARLGVVIAARGGALAAMLAPFRLGLGGPMGSGRQYLSWISLDDVLGIMLEAIFNESLRGPVNLTAPAPVTNREFVRTLGRVLRRPTVLGVPGAAIRVLFGEMGVATVLASANVLPQKIAATGYAFRHPTLESALRTELGRLAIPPGWGDLAAGGA